MVVEIPKQEELDWIKLREDLDQFMVQESFVQKVSRKFGQNPMIPIGCTATVAALTYGLYNMVQGQSMMSQYMMRARIVAQGVTVVAVLVSLSTALPKQES